MYHHLCVFLFQKIDAKCVRDLYLFHVLCKFITHICLKLSCSSHKIVLRTVFAMLRRALCTRELFWLFQKAYAFILIQLMSSHNLALSTTRELCIHANNDLLNYRNMNCKHRKLNCFVLHPSGLQSFVLQMYKGSNVSFCF